MRAPTAATWSDRGRALDLLCSADLANVVEMVLSNPAPNLYEARAVDGTVRFRRRPENGEWRFEVVGTDGRNPLAKQDPASLSPLSVERAAPRPGRHDNVYPHAFDRIAQVFDHPAAPDLYVVHTAAYQYEAHRGEHGSIDLVQSRAPLVLAGAGVRRLGLVPRHCQLVDIAPTILALLGFKPNGGIGPTGGRRDDALLLRQDGHCLAELLDLDTGRAERVVIVLFDGANANVLYDAAERGKLPNVARLIAGGTALAHGAIASLPTVTLPNHTAIHTGCHPGHHGVLHNAWYDRSLGRQIVTESPATWQEAMQWLLPGIETIHEAVHRYRPGATTVSVNEPADRGADYSTFDLYRSGEQRRLADIVPLPDPLVGTEHFHASQQYRWGSLVDTAAAAQFCSIWGGELFGRSFPVPDLTWVNFTLTDAAFHEGGPYSEMAEAALVDTDHRLGKILGAVEARGAWEGTAVALVADHGMEENDPTVRGSLTRVLDGAGIRHRNESSGFIYLGVPPDAA